MKKEFAIAKFIRGLLSGGIGGVYCGEITSSASEHITSCINEPTMIQFDIVGELYKIRSLKQMKYLVTGILICGALLLGVSLGVQKQYAQDQVQRTQDQKQITSLGNEVSACREDPSSPQCPPNMFGPQIVYRCEAPQIYASEMVWHYVHCRN